MPQATRTLRCNHVRTSEALAIQTARCPTATDVGEEGEQHRGLQSHRTTRHNTSATAPLARHHLFNGIRTTTAHHVLVTATTAVRTLLRLRLIADALDAATHTRLRKLKKPG